VALEDARATGRVIGVKFSMEKSTAKSGDELVQQISGWMTSDGVHFVLADLPATALKDLARGLADRPILLFNISAPDDSLRGADCANNADFQSKRNLAADWLQIQCAAKVTTTDDRSEAQPVAAVVRALDRGETSC
jgi:hypothetical protein